MSDRVTFGEGKYEYELDDEGRVSLNRYGQPWIGPGTGAGVNAPKAWIAAANEIRRLRFELEDYKAWCKTLSRMHAEE